MSCIDHQRQKKGRNGIKGRQKQVTGYKFHGTCKNKHTHKQRIHKRKSFAPHHKSIGHSQKQEPDTNRQCIRKRCPERFLFHVDDPFRKLYNKIICENIRNNL